MVSPISFTSTYKVNNQNIGKFLQFQDYALNKEEQEDGVKTCLKDEIVKKNGFGKLTYAVEQTLIVPDYMDPSVEIFCVFKGIDFKKYDNRYLLSPRAIKSRIMEAPEKYKKVNVDVEKLEELAKNQISNIDHCRSDYDKYYSDSVDTMIKSGDEIPATTLNIHGFYDNKDLKRYVNRFGADHLNNRQIFVDFSQQTDDPDHCIYFALKDLGMDKIPVYVDSQSYEAGNILGLF